MFAGSNPSLNAGMKQAGQTSGWANTKGQGLTNQAGDFYSTLLSGNSAAMAKLLGPEIATQQKQAQQAKQATAQFGNRSGGTNAAMQTVDDKARANISQMVSDLTAKAATGAASMGQSLVDTGLTALGVKTQMSQQQMQNWSNSIFGQALGKVFS
jgi:hypothetical protein